MNKTSTLPVLIVGAGPTGLMAACQLSRLNIPFRIIDKKSGPTKESRALVIQARSLEIFRQMGIADQALAEGTRVNAINFIIGKAERRIPLGKIGKKLTEFPYLFVLEQSKTEEMLAEFLKQQKIKIEWNTELVSFIQEKDNVSAIIEQKNKKEDITATYLIAADGSHSIVRKTLQIPFAGAMYKQAFYVLDCAVTGLPEDNTLYLLMNKKSFTLLFPMTAGRCRIVGTVPEEYEKKESITFEDVAPSLQRQLPDAIKVSKPDWISFYHTHHRCVSTFRSGRIFLAGDAAHIHSPAGAQGMNTGLQDAYNLAWKIAYVIEGKSPESLLDTYNAERLPFARQLVKTTDRLFSFVVDEHPWKTFLRMKILPRMMTLLVKTGYVKHFVFPMISQIAVNYRGSIIYHKTSHGRFHPEAPRPGDRLPYALRENESGNKQNIQHLVDGKHFEVFIFSKRHNKDFIQKVHTSMKKNNNLVIRQVLFNKRTKKLYELFGIENDGYYIVRPDMYIGYRSNGYQRQHIQKFLSAEFTQS